GLRLRWAELSAEPCRRGGGVSPRLSADLGHARGRQGVVRGGLRLRAMTDATDEHLRLDQAGRVAWITFNRPDARNAMTFEMYERLHDLCERLDHDPGVRVLVLRGAGDKAFVSGTDIRRFLTFTTREDALSYEARLTRVLGRIHAMTKPTIAMVRATPSAAASSCRSPATFASPPATHASVRPWPGRSATAPRPWPSPSSPTRSGPCAPATSSSPRGSWTPARLGPSASSTRCIRASSF